MCLLAKVFFSTMATIYKQLTKYCQLKNIPIPPVEVRRKIGNSAIQVWFDKQNLLKNFFCLHKANIKENDGIEYIVICYPKKFIPVIDAIIRKVMAFYLSSNEETTYNKDINIKTNNKRKRILIKPTPTYSTKNYK